MTKTKDAPDPREITIEGIGPIREALTILLPVRGGLVVLSGDHGQGKSTALRTISALGGGKQELTVNDDSPSGQARGFGVKLTVGKNVRRSGEAAFRIDDGQSTMADLADPGINDPDARNRYRIKSLLLLAGAKPDIGLFDGVIDPNDRVSVLKPDTLRKDDLISMAASVKRDLEAAARTKEGEADNLEGQALASANQAAGIDRTIETDGAKLRAAHDEAILKHQDVRSREKAFLDANKRQGEAEAAVSKAMQQYPGPSLGTAHNTEATAGLNYDAARKSVVYHEEQLAAAKAKEETSRIELSAAIAARKAAESHESSLAAWKAQIAASLPDCPTEEEVEQAEQAVQQASQRIEAGAVARKATESIEASETALQRAKEARQAAMRHREAAKATDVILSDAVARVSTRLKVGTGNKAGWLVVDTDRGIERFDDLSEGERIREALDVAIGAVRKAGTHGCLVIPQAFFEQLSPATRIAIDEQLREAGVIGFTAVVTDEPKLAARIAGNGKAE